MVFAAGSVFAQSSDPLNATWKLNLAKSTYSPGPAPKDATVKFEGTDAARTVTVDLIPATGAPVHYSFSGATGKELPVVGNPNADVEVLKRVNATTLEAQYMKGGKPTLKQSGVISADGKTLTITATGTDAQGQTVHNVAVYGK